jgi:ectoine hydroxylase-related dioxygenase (phytanoyl-CoA dioxygenase family)
VESRILLSENEIAQAKLDENTLKIARHLFEVHGYLKIDNLFAVEFIQALGTAFLSQLDFNETEMTLSSGTEVAHHRYIVPIPFQPPFNDPELYAHPILLSLMKEFLGPHCILSTLGSVVSLPGATDQHLHADYLPLFEESPQLTGTHPPYAITVGIPLVDIDLLNGPTKIWSGSHRTYPIETEMRSYYRHLLCGAIGSCYFWDYRTFHAGGSNHSEKMRPLLYMGYTRRWFKDALNPDQLKIEDEEYQKIPEVHRKLFAHLETRSKTNSSISAGTKSWSLCL